MTNHENDIRTDDQFIAHDEREEITVSASNHQFWEHIHDDEDDENPVWIENADGSGQWSDGWTGDVDIKTSTHGVVEFMRHPMFGNMNLVVGTDFTIAANGRRTIYFAIEIWDGRGFDIISEQVARELYCNTIGNDWDTFLSEQKETAQKVSKERLNVH